jgi:hypothetical protein
VIHHIPETVDLAFGLDHASYMIVEARGHTVSLRDLADLVERLGKLPELIGGHGIVGVDMSRHLHAREPARSGIVGKAARRHIQRIAADCLREGRKLVGARQDISLVIGAPEIRA